MTAIAGLVHDGTVWLGGDSAATDEMGASTVIGTAKVIRRGAFVIGASGGIRAMQIIASDFKPPRFQQDESPREYLVRRFVPAVRAFLEKAGCDEIKEGETHLIVGTRGVIAVIQQGWGVVSPADGYAAIGSGAAVALGALHALRHDSRGPRERIATALAAAAHHNATVRPPFVILSTGGKS